MSAILIDGKAVATVVREGLGPRIAVLKSKGITPGLAAVIVGDDPASMTYVASKSKACQNLGLYSEVIRQPANLSESELLTIVQNLNLDEQIHGILVQSPLPGQIDELKITEAIDPRKDVDGFHPHNVGLMMLGHGKLLPCTPHGILKLLEYYGIPTRGAEVVVVGRSNIVGKPMAIMLAQKGKQADATVTIAHSQTRSLGEITRRADILIVATGRPDTIKAEMVKSGVVIIDVGVNRIEDQSNPKGYHLAGDVDFAGCVEKASYMTPVPGGVGPMTIAMLMANTVTAAELSALSGK